MATRVRLGPDDALCDARGDEGDQRRDPRDPLPLPRPHRGPLQAAAGLAADGARRLLLPGRRLMRRVLARRDMRLYVIAQTLSMFGDTALWLALAVWAKTLTGSSAAAGMVIFGITAPGLFAPFSGLLADRV